MNNYNESKIHYILPLLYFPQRGKIFHKIILKTKQHFPLPLGEGPRVRGKTVNNEKL